MPYSEQPSKTPEQIAGMLFSIRLGKILAENYADELNALMSANTMTEDILEMLELPMHHPEAKKDTLIRALGFAINGYDGSVPDFVAYSGVVSQEIVDKRNHASKLAVLNYVKEHNLEARWTENRVQRLHDRMAADQIPIGTKDELIILDQLLRDPSNWNTEGPNKGKPKTYFITQELNRICHRGKTVRHGNAVTEMMHEIMNDWKEDPDAPNFSSETEEDE